MDLLLCGIPTCSTVYVKNFHVYGARPSLLWCVMVEWMTRVVRRLASAVTRTRIKATPPPPPPSTFIASLVQPTSLPQDLAPTGPFQMGITSAHVNFINNTLPKAIEEAESVMTPTQQRQLELQRNQVRKVIGLENANAKGVLVYNIQQAVGAFKRKAHDTGSPEVQGMLYSID
jgi:hypothetical protein